MKLQAHVGDETKDIELRRDGEKLFAEIDGRSYALDVSRPESGVYLFKHNGRVFEASVTDPKAVGEATHVRIGSSEFDITLVDPKKLRSAGSGTDHGDGLAEIRTAMPGKVVRILVAAGDAVEKGDGVIVVEAMKMQNELKSPKDGTIKEIRASEGAAVSSGDVLVIIE